MALDGRGRRLTAGLVSALSLAALAAAPAGAGAATYALDPDGTLASDGWTATPSTTPHWDLLNDGVRVPSPPSAAGDHLSRSDKHGQGSASFSLTNVSLAPGEKITDATLWVYVTTGPERTFSTAVWTLSGTVLGTGTVPAGVSDTWFPVSLTTPSSASQINSAFLTIGDEGRSGTSYAYAAYIEVNTRTPPPPPPGDPPPGDPPPSDPPPSDPPPSDPPPSDPPPSDPPPSDPPPSDPPPSDPPPSDPPPSDPPPSDPPPSDPPPSDPPPSDPPPSDPLAPDPGERPTGIARALEVAGTRADANTKGLVSVALRCATTATRGCQGFMWLEEVPAAKPRKSSVAAARRGRRIGKRVRYTVKRGRTSKVGVRLDRAAFRKLGRKRSFKVQVVFQQQDASGRTATLRRTIRVFPRTRKK